MSITPGGPFTVSGTTAGSFPTTGPTAFVNNVSVVAGVTMFAQITGANNTTLPAVSSVADSVGNIWTVLQTLETSDNANDAVDFEVWYATAGTTTSTLTVTANFAPIATALTIAYIGVVTLSNLVPGGIDSVPSSSIGNPINSFDFGTITNPHANNAILQFAFAQTNLNDSEAATSSNGTSFGTQPDFNFAFWNQLGASGNQTATITFTNAGVNNVVYGGTAFTWQYQAPVTTTPSFSPVAGYFATGQSVTITCSTPSSTITYTTDGSTPVPGSHGTVYATPVSIASSQQLKAVGAASGFSNSVTATGNYYIVSITSTAPTTARLDSGQTIQLTGGVVSGGSTDLTDWSSSNAAIATVSSSGLVTGRRKGTSTITAASDELSSVHTTTTTITVVSLTVIIDIDYLQAFLNTFVQSISPANPLLTTLRAQAVTALVDLQSYSLTIEDINLLQSLISNQVQTLGTNAFEKTAQAKAAAALADLRSLL